MALSDNLNILFPITVNENSIAVIPTPVTTLPAKNVFNSRRDKFLRIIGTNATIKFNTNSLEETTAICLGFLNLTDSSTIRIRLYNDFNQTGLIVHDSNALPGVDPAYFQWELENLFPQVYFYSFEKVNFKSVVIDIVAPGNSQIDIGRIMTGFIFEPKKNYSLNSKWQWQEEGNDRISGNKYRIFSLDLKYLENIENDRYEYEKMKAAKQGDLLVCLQPSATGLDFLKNTAICKRVNDISRVRYRENTNKHRDLYKEVI